MAGPVLVSLTRSWARPPTAASWVADVSTTALSGTGLTHPDMSKIRPIRPATFIPAFLNVSLTKSVSDYCGRLAQKRDARNVGAPAIVSTSHEEGVGTHRSLAGHSRLLRERPRRGSLERFSERLAQPDTLSFAQPIAEPEPLSVTDALRHARRCARLGSVAGRLPRRSRDAGSGAGDARLDDAGAGRCDRRAQPEDPLHDLGFVVASAGDTDDDLVVRDARQPRHAG